VCFIDAAARDFMASGQDLVHPEWTDEDFIAVERHIHARLDGLLRRPRKAAPS
jgi:hypothetical protein